jgi:nitrogen regulatory protein P-II 1
VHADVQQDLADVLHNLIQVKSFIFTHVESHSTQDSEDTVLSAHDLVVGYTPHVRVEIVLNDEDVGDVLSVLQRSDSGIAGRGIFYWATEIAQHGKL